jgi:threonine aldolase
MNVIDLRSDTVSHPTPQMREAMANAVVGDDVYGEDPTVIQLERDAAQMLGFEAGLFVASGTQGNLIALLTHCERGSEAIVGDKAHTFVYEAGGMSALGGITPHIVKVHEDGHIDLDDIRHAIRGDNYHFPRTRLISIENTQGTVGGLPLSPAYMHSVAELAHAHGLIFHVDGARIFNASTAYNVPIDEMVRGADSVTFCLSKGLCAPVGSILVGSQAFIAEARRTRKLLGGGMRQVGILAAAGLLAIHEMSKRLHIDHENAAYLAEGLSDVPHIQVASNATNFVFFWLQESAKLTPNQFNQVLAQRRILMSPYPGFERKYRCVTHYWITKDKIDEVLHAMKEILA